MSLDRSTSADIYIALCGTTPSSLKWNGHGSWSQVRTLKCPDCFYLGKRLANNAQDLNVLERERGAARHRFSDAQSANSFMLVMEALKYRLSYKKT